MNHRPGKQERPTKSSGRPVKAWTAKITIVWNFACLGVDVGTGLDEVDVLEWIQVVEWMK